MNKKLINKNIQDLHNMLMKKKISVVELVQESLKNIEEYDDKLKSFITVTGDLALKKAKAVDSKISKRIELKPLEGIPYSAKDVFTTKGIKTTAGSKMLNDFIPPYDATVIKRINSSGGILIGKTNCDPFGFGSSTENSGYFPTHNPYDLNRVPGGSSGGSAASVASYMGAFSIAEDTGGSIRQPCSFCNLSGIKVTYGRVSRHGSIAYGSSLDTVGHMARNVEDLALILEYTAGEDEKDATTVPKHVPSYTQHLKKPIRYLQIGLPKEYYNVEGFDPEVKDIVFKAAKKFERMGCHLEEISLPHTKYAVSDYYLTSISEVSANLARYDGIRFGVGSKDAKDLEDHYLKARAKGFEDEVKRRIMLGTFALSAGYLDAYYKKAQKVRTLLKHDFDNAFKSVDVILAPVAPSTPFKIGEHEGDPLSMWLEDVFTTGLNPTGSPGLAIPAGFSENNLPVGMQIFGPLFSEDLLFRLGYHFQRETDYHKRIPPILEEKK